MSREPAARYPWRAEELSRRQRLAGCRTQRTALNCPTASADDPFQAFANGCSAALN